MKVVHPYATLEYARSLSHIGEALSLPEWGGTVLARPIDAEWRDVTGCYPLAVLEDRADIRAGMARLRAENLVSAVLVVDDYWRPGLKELEEAFDFVRPFKTHYVLDRREGPLDYSRNHRYKVNRALKTVRVEAFDLVSRLDDWKALYDGLAKRHGLDGVHAFAARHHDTLAEMDGVTTVGGFIGDALVACHIWIRHEGHAHSHLVASSPEGYAERAAYAVNHASIEHLADCLTINFGGGAGAEDGSDDGLARFKNGFCNTTARSYLCGKVLEPDVYDALAARAGVSSQTAFFPRYRAAPGA